MKSFKTDTNRDMEKNELHSLPDSTETFGFIYHEVINPLSTLKAQVQFLKMLAEKKQEVDPQLLQALTQMNSTISRIANIMKGFRSLAGTPQNIDFAPRSLKAIIEESANICFDRLQEKNVELLIEKIPATIVIECNEGQLCQIFVNLINNSIDAISDLSKRWIEFSFVDEGDMVCISVRDSGTGLSVEAQNRIAEPFYSTKSKAHNLGLGLSICLRLAQHHSGSLQIEHTDSNTHFVLRLPKVQMRTNLSP